MVTRIEEAKREINERRKVVVLEIRTRAALEIEQKKEVKLSLY